MQMSAVVKHHKWESRELNKVIGSEESGLKDDKFERSCDGCTARDALRLPARYPARVCQTWNSEIIEHVYWPALTRMYI